MARDMEGTMGPARRTSHRLSGFFLLQFATQKTVVWSAVVIFLIGAPYFVWSRWGKHFVRADDYRLSVDSFEATPQPRWIQADVVAEVVQRAQLDELSALDPKITVKVGQAFALHPWVSQIKLVSKKAGPKIMVRLDYRRPLAMVAAPNGGFWPVDVDAVLLPSSEFSPAQVRKFMLITVPKAQPAGSAGAPFGNRRVNDCAKIARLFINDWQKLGFERIVALPIRTRREEPQYALVTRFQNRILWGRAPGSELDGERTAEEKVSALAHYVAQSGALDRQKLDTDLDLRFPSKRTARQNQRRELR